MARARKITTDDILDAAVRVVTRLGAAGLSIDAVAQEAGVSKSRVVYDHKSKQALLEALIERHFKLEAQRMDAAVEAEAPSAHPELFGRLSMAEDPLDDTERAVAMAVGAALSQDNRVQGLIREWTDKDLAAMRGGKRPMAALIAYLALSGLYCTELFAFHHWDPLERQQILDGIRAVYAHFPDET